MGRHEGLSARRKGSQARGHAAEAAWARLVRHWEYDKVDPDEDFAVERLRRVYLLTDAKGVVMEVSTIYQSIGIEQPKEIEAAIRAASRSGSAA
jgi:hypothetical protein